jgi:hypothetical protein
MEDILNKAIEEFVANTGGSTPSVIVINPVAWDDLVDEFLLSKGVKVTPSKMKCRFSVREFPVYRSEDLSIDDPIKVY